MIDHQIDEIKQTNHFNLYVLYIHYRFKMILEKIRYTVLSMHYIISQSIS